MLGKNLLLSDVCHDPAINNFNLMGPLGNVHVDTIVLSWACMGVILAAAAMLKPVLVAEGAGGAWQGVAEGIYKFIYDLTESQMGHQSKKYFPLIAAIFIFVLIANLSGIFPWKALETMPGWFHIHGGEEALELASPTTDFNVTAGLAALATIVYLTAGYLQHGSKYIVLLFTNPVEWLDLLIRPSTLALRLMLVITADEIVRLVFLLMLPWIAPSFVMAFEIFIALIQAFVFALLTSIYIGLATSEHH